MFADQFAGAIEHAQFHELNDLASKLWKAFAAGHLDDATAQNFAEAIAARKPKLSSGTTVFRPPKAPRPSRQRSPDKAKSIERRRRLARASPVPPELVGQFTQGEHAVLTVVCGEIQHHGHCDLFLAKIAALAGVCRTLVKTALRKGRAHALLHSEERRRRGQKSLTNIVRALRRDWGRWLRRIGGRKTITTTDKYLENASSGSGESFGERVLTSRDGVQGPKRE